MTVPTRIIEEDEFIKLMNLEGDMIPLYKLTNIPFHPPLPGNQKHKPEKVVSMNIMMMNVTEPVIYKDKARNMAFIIINGYDHDSTMTYENFNDIHLIKNSWGYRLGPSYWDPNDKTDDLDDCWWAFKHEEREGQSLDEL